MLKVPSNRPIFATMPAFYERVLRPYLQSTDGERKKSLVRGIIAGGGLFILGFIGLSLFTGGIGIIQIVLPGTLGAGVGSFIIDKTRSKITDDFVGKIAGELGFSYARALEQPDYFDHFDRLKFFGSYDRIGWEDEIKGTHAGTEFTLCEAHLTERRGKNNTQHTVFHGQLLVIAYPRTFYGQTVLRRDRAMLNRLGKPGKEFKNVGLASAKFEKVYEAWATDQVEARYLLDPVVLERFQALEELFGSASLQAAFTHGKLLISLASGDRLSMGSMFSTLDDHRRVELILAELDTIFDLIDLAINPDIDVTVEPLSLKAVKTG